MLATTGTATGLSNDKYVSLVPRKWRPGNAAIGVLYCHGYTTSALLLHADAPAQRVTRRGGWPMLATDLGGTATFGNATAVARIGQAKTWMEEQLGTTAGPMLVLAHSMGALNALEYAKAHPDDLAAMALIVPLIDLEDVHDRNPATGIATAIETAYGGLAGYQAALTTHSPAEDPSAYEGFPLQMWVSEDDTVCLPSIARDWATDRGDVDVMSQGSVGHSTGGIDVDAIVAFFAEHA